VTSQAPSRENHDPSFYPGDHALALRIPQWGLIGAYVSAHERLLRHLKFSSVTIRIGNRGLRIHVSIPRFTALNLRASRHGRHY
jgi:hypothetical protein